MPKFCSSSIHVTSEIGSRHLSSEYATFRSIRAEPHKVVRFVHASKREPTIKLTDRDD
jgi:hypothetical protein